MSQRLVNGILVLNTMADILGNSSESSFHGESNGILSIGVLLPFIEKYRVEHRKFVGQSDSPTKPYLGPNEYTDKAPNQVSRHPPMRESTNRGSHGLSCDVSALDYIAIFPPIFIFS